MRNPVPFAKSVSGVALPGPNLERWIDPVLAGVLGRRCDTRPRLENVPSVPGFPGSLGFLGPAWHRAGYTGRRTPELVDATDINALLSEYGDSLECVLPKLLGVLGEGIVHAELRKRGITSKLCPGQKRAVDLETESGLRIQVKTAQKHRFVTGIAQKRFDAGHVPDVWVLVLLTSSKARFFILTHEEICSLQKVCNDEWNRAYFNRHGRAFEKQGVDTLLLDRVKDYEDQWEKLR